MKVIVFIVCVIQFKTGLLASLVALKTAEISETIQLRNDFVRDTSFWTTCSFHFNSTRTLTLILDKVFHEVWETVTSDLASLLVDKLNIALEVFSVEFYPLQRAQSDKTFGEEITKLEYPPESSHSYLIVSCCHFETRLYIQTNDTSKEQWKTKDNYMVLIILHPNWQNKHFRDDVEIFEELWRRKILNVILLEKHIGPTNRGQDSINVYNPLQNTEKKVVIRVSLNDFALLPTTYLERTWKLGNYSLKVTMFDSFPNAVMKCEPVCSYTGRDWEVIKNLAEYMNFKPVVFNPTDGKKSTFKTNIEKFTGAMKDLIEKTADISGNERYIKYYDSDDIAFTMPAFYTKRLVVIVTKAKKLSSWEAIYSSFNFYFWMYLLIVFIISMILWYIIRKLQGKVYYISHLLDTMSVFLTMSVNFLTRATSHSQRIFLSFSMLFSLVVMCLIQSSLLDSVAHPHFNKDIMTLAQLDATGLQIVTLDPNLLDTFDDSEYMGNLSSKLTHKNEHSDSLIENIVLHRNICLLTSDGDAVWFLGKYPNVLHVVPEYPREYFVSYMIHKDSPYATRIHNLLGKMSAGGLVLKWDEDTRYTLQLEALAIGRNYFQNKESMKVFKLVDFYLAFAVWGVGVTAGFIFLLIENSLLYRINIYRVSPLDSQH
ncbi:Ionotropic receptor [Blattella germanica]|nr:Ionotropic receptor [Blattella germanica]